MKQLQKNGFFIASNLYFDVGAELDAGSISGSDYLTTKGISAKIADKVLKNLNDARSNLSAINNCLDFTIANLQNVSEKTIAAI